MDEIVLIYCPDCRGKFDMEIFDLEEGEIIECPLCMGEMEVLQMDPFRVSIFLEE